MGFEKYQLLVEKLTQLEDVSSGKMMSSPALKKNNKVFAFYHNNQMIFRMGKGFNPESVGIEKWSFLSPFKEKPPMTGWYEIPSAYSILWEDLALKAMGLL